MIKIGGTILKNPICVAASPHIESADLDGVGAIFTKTITMEPREGNSGQIHVDLGGSMINRVGLANEGLRVFVRKGIYQLRKNKVPIFVSIHATNVIDVRDMAAVLALECGELLAGIELNLSCPNIQDTQDNVLPDKMVAQILVAACVEGAEGIPVLVKLPPWPDRIAGIAEGAVQAGACALSATNTIKALTIIKGQQFLGGLSGEALKPISLRCVYEIMLRDLGVPIIGVGGIETLEDIGDYFQVGARAIQIGTAEMRNPGTAKRLAIEWKVLYDEYNSGGTW